MEMGSVFFIFTAGVSTSNFQPHQSMLSSQNRDPTKLARSCERWDRLKVRIGLFRRRAICSCMREVMLKLTMDYKMTKHKLNNCTLKESRTWLLVCTRHSYFIPFNHEHPVIGTYFQSNNIQQETRSIYGILAQ